VVHNFFAGVVTLTELTGSAVATYMRQLIRQNL